MSDAVKTPEEYFLQQEFGSGAGTDLTEAEQAFLRRYAGLGLGARGPGSESRDGHGSGIPAFGRSGIRAAPTCRGRFRRGKRSPYGNPFRPRTTARGGRNAVGIVFSFRSGVRPAHLHGAGGDYFCGADQASGRAKVYCGHHQSARPVTPLVRLNDLLGWRPATRIRNDLSSCASTTDFRSGSSSMPGPLCIARGVRRWNGISRPGSEWAAIIWPVF